MSPCSDCFVPHIGLTCGNCPNLKRQYQSGYKDMRKITSDEYAGFRIWIKAEIIPQLVDKEWPEVRRSI